MDNFLIRQKIVFNTLSGGKIAKVRVMTKDFLVILQLQLLLYLKTKDNLETFNGGKIGKYPRFSGHKNTKITALLIDKLVLVF